MLVQSYATVYIAIAIANNCTWAKLQKMNTEKIQFNRLSLLRHLFTFCVLAIRFFLLYIVTVLRIFYLFQICKLNLAVDLIYVRLWTNITSILFSKSFHLIGNWCGNVAMLIRGFFPRYVCFAIVCQCWLHTKLTAISSSSASKFHMQRQNTINYNLCKY